MSGLVAIGLAATLLAACSDDDPKADPQVETSSTPEPVFPPLDEAWRMTLAKSTVLAGTPIRSDGLLVLRTHKELLGVDEQTGEQIWRKPLREICSVVDGIHDQKLVLSHSTRGRRGACAELLALDPATGKVAWRRSVPGGIGSGEPDEIDYLAVGDRVVTGRRSVCGGIDRFRLRDGRPLAAIRPMGDDNLACDDFALKGRWIAQVATDDNQDAVGFRLIDGDTGRTVFDRPIRLMSLYGIASTDPLVMDLAVKGHRLLWAVDPKTGKLGTPISGQVSTYRVGPLLAATFGDTLTVSAATHGFSWESGRAAGVAGYGFDGTERWSAFPSIGKLVGGDERGAVVVTNGIVGDTNREQGIPITRHSWVDVADYEVLGTIPAGAWTQYSIGDLLLTRAGSEVVAYRLPATGEKSDVELKTFDDVLAQRVPEEAWAADDIRPREVLPCAVSDDTLRSLGFHQLDLPRPIVCGWMESQEPEDFRRELTVGQFIGTPTPIAGSTSDDPKISMASAVSAAEAQMDAMREDLGRDSGFDGLKAIVRDIPGVGDEAIIAEAVGVGSRQSKVEIAVRVRNVVVRATMEGVADEGEATALASPNTYAAGVWSAVSESLTALGVPVTTPTATERRTPRLRAGTDLCAAVGAQVSTLVPGLVGERWKGRADRATAGCAWRAQPGAHDSAQVSMVRIADSAFSGQSGKQLAKAGMAGMRAESRRFATEPQNRPVAVPGLGDEAWAEVDRGWLHRSGGQSTTWWVATVLVRRGDLSVTVQVQSKDWDPVVLRERAVSIARTAVATQR